MYGIMLISLKDGVSNVNSLGMKEKTAPAPQFVATVLLKVIPIHNATIRLVCAPTAKADTELEILVAPH